MDKKVTIYSTPTCHFCHMTKEYLTEHKIPYTDFDVAHDLTKRQEMILKIRPNGGTCDSNRRRTDCRV